MRPSSRRSGRPGATSRGPSTPSGAAGSGRSAPASGTATPTRPSPTRPRGSGRISLRCPPTAAPASTGSVSGASPRAWSAGHPCRCCSSVAWPPGTGAELTAFWSRSTGRRPRRRCSRSSRAWLAPSTSRSSSCTSSRPPDPLPGAPAGATGVHDPETEAAYLARVAASLEARGLRVGVTLRAGFPAEVIPTVDRRDEEWLWSRCRPTAARAWAGYSWEAWPSAC